MPICINRITILYMMLNFCFQLNISRDLPYFPKNISMRVYEGTPAQLGEMPYQIAFKQKHPRDKKLFYTFCGGAIIGEAKTLSAAHCFVVESTAIFSICFGHGTYLDSLNNKFAVAGTLRNLAYEQAQYEQWRNIEKILYPHDYKFPINDIAVVFVKDRFHFHHYVKPINYATQFEDYEGLCLVSGYGRISPSISSDSLLKAYLLLLPDAWCSKTQRRDMSFSICTSVVGPDIGKGDSGSPLVCTQSGVRTEYNESGILVGIASGTYPGIHSTFVRVSSYRRFIEKNYCTKPSSICYVVVNILLLPNYIRLFSFDLFEFY